MERERMTKPVAGSGSQRKLRVPMWVPLVVLAVASLGAVGAVSFLLIRANAEDALGRVGESYRGLACTVVEDEVVSFLGTITTAAGQLAEYVAESDISPANPTPADLRKEIALSLTALAGNGPTSLFLGLPHGELFGVDVETDTGNMYWDVSNNMTGYKVGSFPAAAITPVNCSSSTASGVTVSKACRPRVLWKESQWTARYGEIGLGSVYNATVRTWFKMGAALSSGYTFAPVYASVVPSGAGSVTVALALPVVYPVRSADTGTLTAVAAGECTLTHFDSFLKQISATLFEGTVAFLVEMDTGYLLASSVLGQQMV
eukprot:RCo054987